ncbi:hypothetical protein PVAG01_07071 [Phlyctema vagabunda]|uniref:Uncharacterized protein n=1 Tax=Phlyctema vagabunda TaxID=108571 RepID=A0ABR4PBD7_9HELO
MVLENSSNATAGGSGYDGAPASDNDAYGSSDGGFAEGQGGGQEIRDFTVDAARFPRGIPVIGGLCGCNTSNLFKLVSVKMSTAENHMSRPFTQEEVQALAYHSAKQLSIASYGAPMGLAGGAIAFYKSTNPYRFPFHTIDPNTFGAERAARMAVSPGKNILQGLRGSAYGIVGYMVGRLVLDSYASTVAAVGEMSDPKLKAYVEGLRAAVMARGKNVPKDNQTGSPIPQTGNAPQTTQSLDDASPTGGVYGDTIDYGFSEAQEQSQQPRSTTQTQRPGQTRGPATAPQPQPQQDNEPFGLFDDASPTNSPQPNTNGTQNQNAGGSAWERLRQQATKPRSTGSSNWPSEQDSNQGSWQRQQAMARNSPGSDSFSYSKQDEESGYAKSQAQKEFDARVEAERGGGDFSGKAGGGDQKRW